MRQVIIVLTCDTCGYQEQFETVRIDGQVSAEIAPVEKFRRRGWKSSNACSFHDTSDYCDKCFEAMQKLGWENFDDSAARQDANTKAPSRDIHHNPK